MNETKTGILHVCASILAEIHNRLAEISGSPQRIEMTMDDCIFRREKSTCTEF